MIVEVSIFLFSPLKVRLLCLFMADDKLGLPTSDDQSIGMTLSDTVMELVWENGQVRVRGLSGSHSGVSYPSSAPKFQAKNDEGMFSAKRRRSDLCSGHQEEPSKHDSSLQNDHHPGLFPGIYQTDFNLFFENARNFDSGVESQVVPVCKNSSSRDGSKFITENPHLTVTEAGNVPNANVNQCLVPDYHTSTKMIFVVEPSEEVPPDEQSKTAGHKNTTFMSKQYCPDKVFAQVPVSSSANKVKEKSRDQPVGTTSMCSRASNDLTCSLKTRNEDNDLITSPSNNVEEGKTSSYYMKAKHAGERGCYKRKRSTEVYNMSERKRRAKINKKMRELQELVPNSDKVDKASMLDQAIEYLKTLQLQVQIMQMGRALCTHSMIFPTGMQYIQAPLVGQFFDSFGMGMHMGSFGCNPATFPASSMLGLSGQMLPTPLSQAPFMPLGPSTPSMIALPNGIWGLPTPGELLGSASLLNSKVSARDSNSGNNVLSSKMQTSSRH